MNPGHRGLGLAVLLLAVSLSSCGTSPPPDPNNPGSTSSNSSDDPPEGKRDESATLDVICTPPSEVKIDGTSIGKSPINGHKVPPGTHDVTCVDEETGPQTMTYTLEPGEGRGVTINRI